MQTTNKAPTPHFSKEDETETTNIYAATSGRKIPSSQNTPSNKPRKEVPLYMGVQPGQVCMDKDIYHQGPIWAKIPDTDGNFQPRPNMGSFGCKHPPPMILQKNTPVPAEPPAAFTETPIKSFISQYSTGQVTVEIDWERKSESSKRWNPKIQFTNNYTPTDRAEFSPNEKGEYNYFPRFIGSRYLIKNL